MSFQSTPPVKAATRADKVRLDDIFISIHAAREGGDAMRRSRSAALPISIHAAREGGDRLVLLPEVLFAEFQSTPPVKAATLLPKRLPSNSSISIHAAREGGDFVRLLLLRLRRYFNPRRP